MLDNKWCNEQDHDATLSSMFSPTRIQENKNVCNINFKFYWIKRVKKWNVGIYYHCLVYL